MTELAVFPLRVVLFPGGVLPLRIFEPRYLGMVSRCLKRDEPFVVVLALPGGEPGRLRCAAVGTTARIVDFGRAQDGLLTLRTMGEARVRLGPLQRATDGLAIAATEPMPDEAAVSLTAADEALLSVLHQLLPDDAPELRGVPRRWDDAEWVSLRGAEQLPLELDERQQLLECGDARARLDRLRPVAVALDSRA